METNPYKKLIRKIALFLSLFLLLSNILHAQKQNHSDTIMGIPYFIKIGEGTGGVKLGVSTINDVEKIFGKGKIKTETSKRLGKVYTEKAISYKKKGLKFFALNDSSSIIYCIEVSMLNARTEKDILVGVSTQDDVLRVYGEPSYRSPESLEYDGMGVVFEFNNGRVQKILLSEKK